VSEQTKRIVSYGVMGLAVTLLLLGFIIGFVDKGKKESEDDNSMQTPNGNEEENIWQYASKEGTKEKSLDENEGADSERKESREIVL